MLCHHHRGCAAIVAGKDKILGHGCFVTGVHFYHDGKRKHSREGRKSERKKKRRQAISNCTSERLYKKSSLGSCNSYIQKNIKRVSMWQLQLLSFSSAQ